MPINEPDVIPVNCEIPLELSLMMEDYRSIANHLIHSLMIRGLPSGLNLKSVCPESAVLSPEAQSDIDIRNDVMLENRSDLYDSTQWVIGPESILTESGDDTNSEQHTTSRLST
jgi:hypothetical protein